MFEPLPIPPRLVMPRTARIAPSLSKPSKTGAKGSGSRDLPAAAGEGRREVGEVAAITLAMRRERSPVRLHRRADNPGESIAGRQPLWWPSQQALAGAETPTIATDPASEAQRTITTTRTALLNMSPS